MIEVIPSILTNSSEELLEMIKKVEHHTKRIHLDISDGIFTSTKTIGYEELTKIDTALNLDVHLMVEYPSKYLDGWFKTKSDRIFIHAEVKDDVEKLLGQIKINGRKTGIVLNPETPIDSVVKFLSMIDYVQFMVVHPGNYGGEFVESVLDKIKEFHNQYPEINIVADGSIHESTAQAAVVAGANILVLGSHIFSEGRDVGEAINQLRQAIGHSL